MNKSYDNELERGRILVFGVSEDAEMKQRIAAFYSEERITEGINLYEATRYAFESKNIEYIESSNANRKFSEIQTRIHDSLIHIRRVGRYLFSKEDELATLLRLNKSVPTLYSAWRSFAQETVGAILAHEAIQQKLSLIELGPEVIAELNGDILSINDLKLRAEKEDGDAQMATQNKEEQFRAFMAYCADLRECLNLFYRGAERQKLEKVGVVVK